MRDEFITRFYSTQRSVGIPELTQRADAWKSSRFHQPLEESKFTSSSATDISNVLSHIQSVGWKASQRGHVHDRRSHRPTAEVKGLRRCAPEAKGCCDHRAIHGDILLGKLNAFLDANILPNLHNLVITLHTLYPVKPFLLRFWPSSHRILLEALGPVWSLKVEKEGLSGILREDLVDEIWDWAFEKART